MPELDVFGVMELDRRFKELPVSLRNKGARKATREAAKIVLQDARALVPHDTGELERSLKVRARKRSRKNRGTVGHSVITGESLFKGDQFYGGFIELGWKHWKNNRPIEPDPYLRPALWGNQTRIWNAFLRHLRDWLKGESKRK